MNVQDGMNQIQVTLDTGDVVRVEYDLKTILANVIAQSIENHSGRAIGLGGLIKAKVLTRVSASRRTVRAREKQARQEAAAGTDFTYSDDGSMVLLYANTDLAREWASAHLPEDRPVFGKSIAAIEWNHFPAILDGIQNDGLTIKEG